MFEARAETLSPAMPSFSEAAPARQPFAGNQGNYIKNLLAGIELNATIDSKN